MGDWQYGMMSKSCGGGVGDDGEEFGEEDVWSIVRDREVANSSSSPKMMKNKKNKGKDGSSSAWHHHSASKKIPRGGGAISATTSMQQSSAPVFIPDWPKIYGANNASDSHWVDPPPPPPHYHGVEEDEDGDGELVPPHEWVARKLAGTQISSFSMCEGVGRTLKGRDLSKVRNAVLTKTGFLEQ